MLDKLIVFPAPREVWVGSYTSSKIWMSFLIIVSGPSRGMGGFLHINCCKVCLVVFSFRPLSRLGWIPTGVPEELDTLKEIAEFPASLEAWVGYY